MKYFRLSIIHSIVWEFKSDSLVYQENKMDKMKNMRLDMEAY